MPRHPPADAKHGEADLDPADHIRLDKSQPYARLGRALPTATQKALANPAAPPQQTLVRGLTEAWAAYIGNKGDGGRQGVRLALAAVLDHINATDPQAGEVLDRFVMVMVAALDDLDRGVTAPLLKPGARDVQNPDSLARKDVRRRAAAAMAVLMDEGHGRDAAAGKVVAVLAENGFQATVNTLKRWYDERLPAEVKQRKGRPPKSGGNESAKHDARLQYVVNRQTAETALDELAWFVRLWFPSGE